MDTLVTRAAQDLEEARKLLGVVGATQSGVTLTPRVAAALWAYVVGLEAERDELTYRLEDRSPE